MTTRTFIRSLFATAAIAMAQSAHANDYGIIAAGCVPTDATVQADRYRTGGHGVFVKGSGTARFTCAIPITGGTWTSVDIYYKDPDGIGSNYEVKGFLKVANLGSTIGTAVCGVSSNGKSATGYTSMRCEFTDFSPSASRWYWIDLHVFRRTGFTQEIEVLGVNVN